MEIITVYYKEASRPSLQAIDWLKEHNLMVQLKKIDTITHREIFQLIYLTGLDTSDILIKNKKFCLRHAKQKYLLNKLRFGESLIFLSSYPDLLQVPIILSDKYALSGYDPESMENFLL